MRRPRAHIVTAGDAVTCKCEEGSIIDYFMISNSLRSCVTSCEVDQDVPWGPHYAVKLTIRAQIESVTARQIFKPALTTSSKTVTDDIEETAEDSELRVKVKGSDPIGKAKSERSALKPNSAL